MSITNFPAGASSFGIPLVGNGTIPSTYGTVYFVDANNGSDGNNGLSMDEAFKTIGAANTAVTTNKNDVIVLSANSSHAITSMLTVSKNRVHFVGLDGGGRIGAQRTKIVITGSTGATNVAAIKVTGTGCSFRNLKIINSHTVSQSLYGLIDAGEATAYFNCSFHNLAAAAPLLLAGDNSHFVECEIGSDTVKTTVALSHTILVDKVQGGQAKRCIFDNCVIQAYTSQTTTNFVKVDAEADLDRYILFRGCSFVNFNNASGSIITDAIEVPAAHAGGFIYVQECGFYGVTNVSQSGINSQVLIQGSVPTAASSGIAVTAA